MQIQNFRGFSGFRGLNVGFRVLLGDQFSGSGSGRGFKSRGHPPRVSGFRVLDSITRSYVLKYSLSTGSLIIM